MPVSKKIYEIMESKGISQNELANRTGITQSTISDWKNKGNTPNSEKLPIVCNALGITINELFDEEDVDVTKNYHIVTEDDELWAFVDSYRAMRKSQRKRLLAYVNALMACDRKEP